jgi:hypothetical protein
MTTKVKPSVLADTAVTPATYGGSSQQAVFTVDAQGRLTYAGNATPSIATSQLTGTISATQVANNQTYGVNITGNSGTVTNGVYTNGSYSDPTWLTLSKSKVGLGNVDNTADANKSVNYATSAGSATTATTAGNGGVTSVNGSTGAVTVPSGFGGNQMWRDVTSSRTLGTTYTNSTGRAIMVMVRSAGQEAGFLMRANCQGQEIVFAAGGAGGDSRRTGIASFIVPDGATYDATYSGATGVKWFELR